MMKVYSHKNLDLKTLALPLNFDCLLSGEVICNPANIIPLPITTNSKIKNHRINKFSTHNKTTNKASLTFSL